MCDLESIVRVVKFFSVTSKSLFIPCEFDIPDIFASPLSCLSVALSGG